MAEPLPLPVSLSERYSNVPGSANSLSETPGCNHVSVMANAFGAYVEHKNRSLLIIPCILLKFVQMQRNEETQNSNVR